MTWISLICFLALSSSAFGRSAYGSGYGAAPAPRLEILTPKIEIPKLVEGYGSAPAPRVEGYGAAPAPRLEILTPKIEMPKLVEGYGSAPAPRVEAYGAAPAPRLEILTPKIELPKPVEGYGSAPAPAPRVEAYGAAPAPRLEILTPKIELPKPVEGYGAAPAPRVEVHTPRFEGYGSAPAPRFEVHTPRFEGYGSAPRVFTTPRFTSGYGAAPAPRVEVLTPKVEGYGSAPRLFPTTRMTTTFVAPTPRLTSGYGAAPAPRVVSGYGSENMNTISFSEPLPTVPTFPVVETEADLMCRGKLPETVIPIGDGQKYIVCIDDGKGNELFCPRGLYYSLETRRCDYRPGSMPDPCATEPCLNGARCNSLGTSYECLCAPGFDGKHCELDARVCQTQSPCGDGFCQSFRPGAALSYICIFQGGFSYGFSTSQAQSNPCRGFDGTFSLGISNRGFIMCDGEKMSIESCPGGTIWDDVNKACSWPELEIAPATSFEQRSTFVSEGSYGTETPRVLIETPKITFNRNFIAPRSGY